MDATAPGEPCYHQDRQEKHPFLLPLAKSGPNQGNRFQSVQVHVATLCPVGHKAQIDKKTNNIEFIDGVQGARPHLP
jgi:hypothetical protein